MGDFILGSVGVVGDVTGVKGDKEVSYRSGNVNLTPSNIGALDVDNVYNGLDKTAAGYALDARQGKTLADKLDATQSDIAIIIEGNQTTHTGGVAVGEYVIVHNSTISGIIDGLYKATLAIPANTAITSAYLAAVDGGLGSEVSSLISKSIYKTNETQVGTWIDGKPIYRCIVSATLPNSKSYVNIANIGNIDLLISSHFILETSTFCSDGATYAGDNTSNINIGFVNKTGEVIYKNNVSNYFGSTVTAILEYTKPSYY